MTTTITATTSIQELPNDPAILKQMLLTLLANMDQVTRENYDLKNQLENFKRRLFGRKSEKLDENQLLLFQELLNQVQQAQAAKPQAPKPVIETKPRPKPTGRKPLPERLPVKRTELQKITSPAPRNFVIPQKK